MSFFEKPGENDCRIIKWLKDNKEKMKMQN